MWRYRNRRSMWSRSKCVHMEVSWIILHYSGTIQFHSSLPIQQELFFLSSVCLSVIRSIHFRWAPVFIYYSWPNIQRDRESGAMVGCRCSGWGLGQKVMINWKSIDEYCRVQIGTTISQMTDNMVVCVNVDTNWHRWTNGKYSRAFKMAKIKPC